MFVTEILLVTVVTTKSEGWLNLLHEADDDGHMAEIYSNLALTK